MNRSSNRLLDPIRLLLLLLFLPLLIIVSGPLLIIAALRGAFALGGFQLRPGKYYRQGRLWALILGILLTVVIWGGGFWLWQNRAGGLRPAAPEAVDVAVNPAAFSTATATATPTRLPSETPVPVVTPPAAATASPTLTPTTPPTPSLTPTTVEGDDSAESTPAPTSDPLTELAQIVTDANELLVVYLETGDEVSDEALATLWQGEALADTRAFAEQTRLRYQAPLTVTFTTVETPTVAAIDPTTLSVQTREFWTYEGTQARREALGEYNYTLQLADGDWKIVGYTFRALPVPEQRSTITNTTVLTSAETAP